MNRRKFNCSLSKAHFTFEVLESRLLLASDLVVTPTTPEPAEVSLDQGISTEEAQAITEELNDSGSGVTEVFIDTQDFLPEIAEDVASQFTTDAVAFNGGSESDPYADDFSTTGTVGTNSESDGGLDDVTAPEEDPFLEYDEPGSEDPVEEDPLDISDYEDQILHGGNPTLP